MSSTAVYADQKNVGANSLLYPLKRSYEDIKIIFTPLADEPVAQAHLATRRLEEIKTIKIENPRDPKIDDLKKDLNKAFTRSVKTAHDEDDEKDSKENQGVAETNASTSISLEHNKKLDDGDSDKSDEKGVIFFDDVTQEVPKLAKRQKTKNLSEKNRSLCDAWDRVLKSDDEDVKDALDNYNIFVSKFEKKCLSE